MSWWQRLKDFYERHHTAINISGLLAATGIVFIIGKVRMESKQLEKLPATFSRPVNVDKLFNDFNDLQHAIKEYNTPNESADNPVVTCSHDSSSE